MWDRHSVDEDFDPIIRFPEAQTFTEELRVQLGVGDDCDDFDKEQQLVGYRATISGMFRTQLDLHMFPFDLQDLQVSALRFVSEHA